MHETFIKHATAIHVGEENKVATIGCQFRLICLVP